MHNNSLFVRLSKKKKKKADSVKFRTAILLLLLYRIIGNKEVDGKLQLLYYIYQLWCSIQR